MSHSFQFVNRTRNQASDAPREKLSARVRRYFQTDKGSATQHAALAPIVTPLTASKLSDDLFIQAGPMGAAWVDMQDAG